jgi:hypothetical protein
MGLDEMKNVLSTHRRWFDLKHTEQQTSKVAVKPFISGDQLVGECQPWHQSPLLQPEYGTERSREEDTLYSSKCHQSLSERIAIIDPFQCPVSFLGDARDRFDGIEQF